MEWEGGVRREGIMVGWQGRLAGVETKERLMYPECEKSCRASDGDGFQLTKAGAHIATFLIQAREVDYN